MQLCEAVVTQLWKWKHVEQEVVADKTAQAGMNIISFLVFFKGIWLVLGQELWKLDFWSGVCARWKVRVTEIHS